LPSSGNVPLVLRSRYLWKLYAGYALVIGVATLLVGLSIARGFRAESLAETDRVLFAEAVLLRELAVEHLSRGDEAGLQQRVRALGPPIGARFTVVAADGRVIAESDTSPSLTENHRGRPEIQEALRSGRGVASRFSNTLGKELRYLAVPVRLDGEMKAVARAALPQKQVADHLASLRTAMATGMLGAIAVGLLLGLWHARRITRPLHSMAEAAAKMAGGSYGERLEVTGGDELAALARALNSLGREMQASVAALEAERDKLKGILEGMGEGVVATDRDERIVHLNPKAAKLLGTSGQVESHPIWEATRLREVSEALSRAMASGERVSASIVQPGAPDRTLDLRASPLFADGETVGAVLVIDDVTQLRRLETMRRDFVANVSHELKTPITAIRGMVETLLDDPQASPALHRRFLEKVLRQAARMGSLVADLLSLARLESGRELEAEPIDLRLPIQASARALQPALEARQVELELELPEQPVLTFGEDEALRQAVSNLLDNAIKYSPPGKKVRVGLRFVPGQVQIEVADQGIGIEAHHRERIFERFYRVDKARSRELGGTGLGLAIVKHVAHALGGEVSVDSVPGSGSTFRIHLPYGAGADRL
jgi:two-component system phosphate regulon sensor histidine kinase PhoR